MLLYIECGNSVNWYLAFQYAADQYSQSFRSFPFLKIVLQVTLIAQGDVPLSIVMTVCTTLGAVILTPLLSKILARTYVPVNAVNLSMSTLQVKSALYSTSYFVSAYLFLNCVYLSV